eukprot:NODE_862_length_3437_cov_1.143499.p2 type:complete len:226 gc:universal NODE_862_length_3437_cov_1.143499:1551-874(-)
MSAIQEFIKLSVKHAKSQIDKALHPSTTHTFQKRMTLYDFSKKKTIDEFKLGSDADNKGKSTCNIEFKDNCAHFYGKLQPNGYAILRSKMPKFSAFGRIGFDISNFSIIELELKVEDDHQYFLNLRADSLTDHHLYQKKLVIPKVPGFQTIQVPVKDLIFTHKGYILQRQSPMDGKNLQTIGLSLMKSPGDFSLFIKKITVFNPLADKYNNNQKNSIGRQFLGRK